VALTLTRPASPCEALVTQTPPLLTSTSEEVRPGYRSANPVITKAATVSTAAAIAVVRVRRRRLPTGEVIQVSPSARDQRARRGPPRHPHRASPWTGVATRTTGSGYPAIGFHAMGC